jgi:hypothetical protein
MNSNYLNIVLSLTFVGCTARGARIAAAGTFTPNMLRKNEMSVQTLRQRQRPRPNGNVCAPRPAVARSTYASESRTESDPRDRL